MIPKVIIKNNKCLDFLEGIDDNSIDLIIIDPPYGVNFGNGVFYNDSKGYVVTRMDKWFKKLKIKLKNNRHIYVFIPTLEADIWLSSIKKNFKLYNQIAVPAYTTNRHINNQFTHNLQLIVYASKGKARNLNKVDWIPTSKSWLNDKRNPSPNKWTYHYPSFIKEYKATVRTNEIVKKIHPNEKNPILLEKLILVSSNQGENVMDCFMGSGNVGAMAKKNGRNFYGCDNNKKWFSKAKNRIETTKFKPANKKSKFVGVDKLLG